MQAAWQEQHDEVAPPSVQDDGKEEEGPGDEESTPLKLRRAAEEEGPVKESTPLKMRRADDDLLD